MELHLFAHRSRNLTRAVLALLWLVALSASTVHAQGGQPPTTDPTAPQSAAAQDAAPAMADEAVREWLSRAPTSILPSGSVTAEELCRQLPSLFGTNAAPAGTEVRLEDRIERDSEDPDLRVFTYAAVRPLEQLDVVEVRLRRAAPLSGTSAPEQWDVEFVGFRTSLELSGVRAWLQTPTAWWLFVAFSLLVLVQLATRGSLLRRWLSAGFEVIRQHRRLVIGTLAALYGMFGLGALSGSALPDECETAIIEVVTAAVTSLGATDAYASGNVARAAVTTFYQNFMVVTLSVTFSLAALLGVPAYLFAALSFFVQGIPFGLLGGAGFLESLLVLVLLVLELTAYFLVVAGGGMLLATLLSPGEGRLFRAYRKLLLTLPIAMLLLLVGAWYEPLILLLVP
ncbi:MAG: hypothetical protein WCY60_02580 [Trueperaceae bacterium]